MESRFFEQPILNSPYEYPARHWELDENRQPTNRIVERRRSVSFITPIPAPRKQRGRQRAFEFDEAASAVGTDDQHYELTRMIESVRHSVDEWRKLPRAKWRVTPEAARLLHHWRYHAGTIGEGVDLNLIHRRDLRPSTLVYHLTKTLLEKHWRDPDQEPKLHLFGQLKRVTRRWLDDHLIYKGDTYPAQLMSFAEFTDVYTLKEEFATAVGARMQADSGKSMEAALGAT